MFDPKKFTTPLQPARSALGPVRDGVNDSPYGEWRKTPVKGVWFTHGPEGCFTLRGEEICFYEGWGKKDFIAFYEANKLFPEGVYQEIDYSCKHLYIQMRWMAKSE